MTAEDIADFINDKYANEDNSIIIEVINKLIKMPINNEFSFKELNIIDSQIINIIHQICNSIELNIEAVEKQNKEIIYPYALELFYEGKCDEFEEELKKEEDKDILFKKTR